MTLRININADMGEGYGRYDIGNDDAILGLVKSVNVACGQHGGDATVMRRVCLKAKENGVSIGAHPGFNDIWGFGRRNIQMSASDLEYLVAYQLGALAAMASYAGIKVTHVKPHGALNNMAAVNADYAMAIGRAIKTVDPSLYYLALSGSEMEKAALALDLKLAREAFVDRMYDDDGNLQSRAIAGSVIRDPALAAERTVRMVETGEILSVNGKRLATQFDSLCIHGDEPTAVAVATAVQQGLKAAGIEMVTLPEMMA
ncbi:5-oxoprolinase subunit PxpA [Ancylobacter sp. 6x-1]|uniref:5-oxoprolinase subunit PxpA n=1 Tax=Ancylobacter crimeensis TaxID=2579147 RepID=A0ABT0DBG8_9HYPH|nr:5-oxoprolinase subunit PxpA [Ancylobacter crimeensis]MCK0197302.1 5-oxoprolinase subunit PxpA [Ancylobacter crimeensis]